MARICPFKALLPGKGFEGKVSANTHVDNLKQQIELVRNNPYTYLNVVKPYLRFNEEKDPVKHFPYAKSALHELLAQKVLVQDDKESLYIYIQTDKGNGRHEFIGLICTVPVNDYNEGRIKIHEKTLTEKEEQLIMHIEMSGVIGEPVLLTHFENRDLHAILMDLAGKGEEILHFSDEINRDHRIIRISSEEGIRQIQDAYAQSGDFYIADGHHRSAASAGYFNRHPDIEGKYLAYVVLPECLKIDSFHRAYKCNSEHFDCSAFLMDLERDFDVSESSAPVLPGSEREFGLLLDHKWYTLHFKHGVNTDDPVEKLDVSILEHYVFRDRLNIHDSKTDKQLSFLKGSTPCSELEAELKAGVYDAVFTLHPCSIEEVFEVADRKLIMPPKSTYIEPKLRTGLTVQMVP